jgi:hypothetical protein
MFHWKIDAEKTKIRKLRKFAYIKAGKKMLHFRIVSSGSRRDDTFLISFTLLCKINFI